MSTKTKCASCNDAGYHIEPKGLYSVAKLCEQCHSFCTDCEDTGYQLKKDTQGRSFAKQCHCAQLKRNIQVFNQTKIPARFYDSTLENFRVEKSEKKKKKLVQKSYDFIANYPSTKGLLFYGGVGTGKTSLACSIIKKLTLDKGIRCMFVEFSTMLREIRELYEQQKTESNLVEAIYKIPVLIIDELGKGKSNEWEISVLDGIISNRYNANLTCIFTTNYTLTSKTTLREKKYNSVDKNTVWVTETLQDRILERNYSRLVALCDFIDMCLPDYRQKEATSDSGETTVEASY